MRKIALFSLLPALGLAVLAACAAPTTGTATDDVVDDDDASSRKPKTDYKRDGSVYDSAVPEGTGLGILHLAPNELFSGTDGEHTFKVPIAIYDGDDDAKLTADDPGAVTITPTSLENPVGKTGVKDTGRYYMLTIEKAGSFTLTATSKGKTATATLTAKQYQPSVWNDGKTRYENGQNGDPACKSCHSEGRAIDHSPAALASSADGEVSGIIRFGQRPGPSPIGDIGCASCSEKGKTHVWKVTDAEGVGLITYLRSLEPRGFR